MIGGFLVDLDLYLSLALRKLLNACLHTKINACHLQIPYPLLLTVPALRSLLDNAARTTVHSGTARDQKRKSNLEDEITEMVEEVEANRCILFSKINCGLTKADPVFGSNAMTYVGQGVQYIQYYSTAIK